MTSNESLSGLVKCKKYEEQIGLRFLEGFVLDSSAYNHLATSPERQMWFIDACPEGQIELLEQLF